jgi:hypothetical protein
MNVNECPICLEDLEAGLKTPCGHHFCAHCIVGWQEKETCSPTTPPYTCPSCRSAIPYITLESYSSDSDESDESVTSNNSRESFVIFRYHNGCKERCKKFLGCMGFSLFTTVLTIWILSITHTT